MFDLFALTCRPPGNGFDKHRLFSFLQAFIKRTSCLSFLLTTEYRHILACIPLVNLSVVPEGAFNNVYTPDLPSVLPLIPDSSHAERLSTMTSKNFSAPGGPTSLDQVDVVFEPDGVSRKNPRNNAATGASAAGVRALSAQLVAFYFRAPVKAFFRTRVEYVDLRSKCLDLTSMLTRNP